MMTFADIHTTFTPAGRRVLAHDLSATPMLFATVAAAERYTLRVDHVIASRVVSCGGRFAIEFLAARGARLTDCP